MTLTGKNGLIYKLAALKHHGLKYSSKNLDINLYKHIMLLLYKNFIVPRFNYCADIWHFCGARNTKKLEDLNKRILRFILNEHNLSYSELLETTSQVSLYNKRLASMLATCYKCIHYERYPKYLKQILNRRSRYYLLRGTDIIDSPKVMTTKYGLHSF